MDIGSHVCFGCFYFEMERLNFLLVAELSIYDPMLNMCLFGEHASSCHITY